MNYQDLHSDDDKRLNASPDKSPLFISDQIYVWGKFVEYSGPTIASEGLELPDDIKLEPWEPFSSMARLTIQGVTVASPAKLNVAFPR